MRLKPVTDVSFAKLVPELKVSDLETSLRFWHDLLGFSVHYNRPEEGFAFLDRDGAQVMLHQDNRGPRPGVLITGEMQRPFGRGINFEIDANDLTPILEAVAAANWPIYLGPEERWRRVGSVMSGVREIWLQDPDGYLVRFSQGISKRPVA
jgi:catechol 2,3-dioxygenase-like lactoylglutathione lyase family enzyme